jgi:hypothetical protein
MCWVEDMFEFKLTSLILYVLNCMAAASIEVYLDKRSSCFALEKFGAPHIVPQASRGSGCTIFEAMPITVAPHPSAAYKYCRPLGFSS